MRIDEILDRRWSLSIELWPPRSPEAAARLRQSLLVLKEIDPSFASITYGAAGSTRDRTHDLVVELQEGEGLTSMAHLACAAHSRAELVGILERYAAAGVENILALRGDPPLDAPGSLPEGELAHAVDLVTLAKSIGPFCVAVAAHPEGHPDSPDLPTDRRHLAEKLSVADFAITQFFFRAEDYFDLVETLSSLGVDKPVVPGIMPITKVTTVTKMAELSGCVIPETVRRRVAAVAEDPEAVRRVGVEIATELCEKLIANRVPGLHFYTMNEVRATLEICTNLGLVPTRAA